jgi:putative hydrolase
MVNSDAHAKDQIGLVAPALEMLESVGFPEELIVNGNMERLTEYLENRRR